MKNKISPGVIISYLMIYIVWGSTYLAIKWSVTSLPPFYLVSFRFLLGGLVFLIIAIASGKLKTLPGIRQVLSSIFLGTFLLILGNGLISVSERQVDSYIAALIISSTPFCVAFFNRLFFKERLSFARLLGMVLGVAGVALILYNGKTGLHFTPAMGLVFIGFVCWAFATSLGHKLPVHPNNLVNSGIQMLYVGIAAFVLSGFIYEPLPLILPAVTLKSWLSLAYLAVFGGAAFYAYNHLLQNEPSIRISSYSIVNPLIAVLLGLLIDGEKPLPFLFFGLPVVLAGMVFMLYGETLASVLTKKKPLKEAEKEDDQFDKEIKE